MKNLIGYYYDLRVDNFKKINEKYELLINNEKYEFLPFYGDINNLYENYLIVIKNKKYSHTPLLNRNKEFLTPYNNKPYLLLKKHFLLEKFVDLNEIISYDVPIYKKQNFNWKNLWQNKINYYEYQMSQLSIKHKILSESFSYYIGLSETAISLLNYINEKEINYYICHRRININEKMDSFFNPVNFVVDSRIRDMAEYIKSVYYSDKLKSEDEFFLIIDNLRLNYTEVILLFSRLLYPSYYFDIYDEVINDTVSQEKINFYIKKNLQYEEFLKRIYNHLLNVYKLPEIEWLIN